MLYWSDINVQRCQHLHLAIRKVCTTIWGIFRTTFNMYKKRAPMIREILNNIRTLKDWFIFRKLSDTVWLFLWSLLGRCVCSKTFALVVLRRYMLDPSFVKLFQDSTKWSYVCSRNFTQLRKSTYATMAQVAMGTSEGRVHTPIRT